jgi:hypothetical protein
MKGIGRRSHALGASTALYNLAIEMAWKYYGDANQVINLLDEMDRLGLDFDGNTLGVVDLILRFSRSVAGLSAALQGPGFTTKIDELEDWRRTILQRIGESDARYTAAFLETMSNADVGSPS